MTNKWVDIPKTLKEFREINMFLRDKFQTPQGKDEGMGISGTQMKRATCLMTA